MSKVRIYEYANCSTCKKALAFLDRHQVSYERIPIVERPPSLAELRTMLRHVGGDLRKLFNTSGQLYRELKMSEKLPRMSEAEALQLLARHGKLIKRPFLLTEKEGAVGFHESDWKRLKL